MLLSTKIENGSIIAIKLVCGNEIIAKLIARSDSVIRTAKPLELGMAPNGSVGFGPFMLGASDNVEMSFSMSMVITVVEARKEIKDAYIQSTSGIVPAGAGSVPEGLIKS